MNMSRRRRIRKIRYFLDYGLRRFAYLGIELLNRLILRIDRKTKYLGIVIADGRVQSKDGLTFINATKAALDLIHQNDPKRFQIVQHEVRIIYNVPLLSFAKYTRTYRQCSVDFGYYVKNGRTYLSTQNEHYEWHLAGYAAVIVHEATHGRLESLYFPYNKVTRVRIERICCAEEGRFAARLKSENYDFRKGLIPEFAEQNWDISWNASLWQKIIRHKELIQKIWKEDPD